MPTVAQVASLDEARAALRNGATSLESPPAAAGHQGIGWWRALSAAVRSEFGPVRMVLDCGDSPGLALAAIRDGIPCLRLDAPPATLAKVRAIAEAAGVEVICPPQH